MSQIKVYGKIGLLDRFILLISRLFKYRKGFIPLCMTLGLKKDLRVKGLTK